MFLAEKTSQTLLHLSVAFGVTYLFTGSLALGGIVALVEPICNVVLLPFHDKLWRKIKRSQRTKRRQLVAENL